MDSTEKAAGNVRARYAPSPTGLQHIGGIRTALFNYLFARSQGPGGKFLLRLEDTDRTRFDERYVKNLYETFDWLGFRWDEGPDIGGPAGPYIQSERFDLYKKYALGLVEQGRAYYCFCSPQRIEEIRKQREEAHSGESGYDRHCRTIDSVEAGERAASGESYAIRLKIPLGETTRFHDRILGDIEWKNDDVNPDPVLLKSDGFPTYHLANVVDDHLMGITHVMRAQEWIPSTPLHVIMYRSFGWEAPEFCHLPMVMGQDGKKLSKRHGATSIDEFRKQGYLREALVNYIALLGCSYEEGKDLYTLEELARLFRMDKLNKAPAVFDYKKLEWYNGQYIRMKSDGELAGLIMPYALEAGIFGKGGPDEDQKKIFTASMALVRERLVFPGEAPAKLAYLFAEPPLPPLEEFFPKKADTGATVALLEKALPLVSKMALMDDGDAEQYIKAAAEKEGVRLGDLMMPLRVAITGARVSPPLFGSLRLLGPDVSEKRVNRAIAALKGAL
ncbi:MAG: glutamate--tRNA ligase [Spirochaetaceae bacterium]|jgi:glutamyl-tRNA synthetase|nr:glutamate--tRNA ligase [Spirochaetaceae bacterium]